MVLLQQHGAAAAELRLCGGGSKNLLWQEVSELVQRFQQRHALAQQYRTSGDYGSCSFSVWLLQIVADVFQLPVVLPAETESAALGVALQAAAVHCGIPVDDFISTMKTPVAKVSSEQNLVRRVVSACSCAVLPPFGTIAPCAAFVHTDGRQGSHAVMLTV